MVEAEIETEVMYEVVYKSAAWSGPQAPGDVGNNDSRQRTQPVTESLEPGCTTKPKKYPQDIILHRVGMTAAGSVETIKVEVRVLWNCETVKRCLRTTE